MRSVSVVIPVKNGGPLLADVLAAVRAQGELELIVTDSGSTDGSDERARAAGAELIHVPPEEFGHGRTRNLAAERASGELICFLTQDAVPEPGWLAAYREAFELDPRVGAAFGPHLPFPDTSPMIARELLAFFAGFSPNGSPVLHRSGDLGFLSNVNACYLRSCWAEIRFPELEYSEDQAFGRAMLEAGWVKVYHPGAAVRHAHDFGPVEFMKRYFDEYRGLREASGHVEPLDAAAALREVAGDVRWMREHGLPARRRARWTVRSIAHHGGRRVASALGSRAERLPGAVQRRMSLERRGAPSAAGDRALPRGRSIPAQGHGYQEVMRMSREGPAPLESPVPGMSERPMHVAVVIPHFARGSGGHGTIFTLMARLEELGHTVSVWLYDPDGRMYGSGAVIRRRIVDEFTPLRAPAHRGFDDWAGADVALATGWDTAYAVSLLPGCRARAYLIQDHEPEFFATSAESLWAAGTYRLGLYGIAASRWLRDLLMERYGQRGSWFRLGVDGGVYRPRPVERRQDTVIFYARPYTPRRAVPLGALALEELHRRRPDTRFVLFGHAEEMRMPFPYELLGVVSPETLAWRYSEATAGLCLSLTNYSLIPQEMMACGLPCVDLAGGSTEAELGSEAGAVLAEADPVAIADALERLLDDPVEWRRRSEAGRALVETASWDVAAKQLESGLREALRERELAAHAPG
ncbi:MAG TPA: glycosyltransferase [Thermoleophilaceae bacterium]|nr:glycosyltransferase [Thermoleophilaceae bacterium]